MAEKVNGTPPRGRMLRQAGSGIGKVVRWAPLGPSDHLPTLLDPFSLVTEQYRMLRMRLDSGRTAGGSPLQVIGMSSSLPSEGKTCTALNVAIAAAQELEKQVLFLECDLRRQRVAKLFTTPPSAGMSDVLQRRARLDEALFRAERPDGLSLIHAGTSPPNPVELLASEGMKRLVQDLRERYQLILIDTPPALNFADASRLGPVVDAFLLVVRAGQTPRDAILKTHKILSPFGLAGVVLNGLPPERESNYSYYYRRYYEPPDESQRKG